jgi:tpl protein
MNMLNDIIFVNIEGKGLQRYSLSEIKFNKKEKIEIEKTQVCCYEESN